MPDESDVPIVDADVVEDHAPTASSEPGSALAHRVRHEVIRPLAPADVVASMRSHQELLRAILDASDWQGTPDAPGSFVKKSGWRKIALAYNLALGRVSEQVERDPNGSPLRATYTAWAEAPNGRRMEASGHCAFGESRFSGPRGNVAKLEHDMRGTAETRAKNRAISDLIGMGKVSAEEVDAGSGVGHATLEPLPADMRETVMQAIAVLISPTREPADRENVKDVAANIAAIFEGGMPKAVGLAIMGMAGRRQRLNAEAEAELLAEAPSDDIDPAEEDPDAISFDRPAAGSVEPPDLTGAQTEAEATQRLRDAGCTCPRPISSGTDPVEADDDCPIKLHGIPF